MTYIDLDPLMAFCHFARCITAARGVVYISHQLHANLCTRIKQALTHFGAYFGRDFYVILIELESHLNVPSVSAGRSSWKA
jgi:hypothetical protein